MKFPPELLRDDFILAWADYIVRRKEQDLPSFSASEREAQLSRLALLGAEEAIRELNSRLLSDASTA